MSDQYTYLKRSISSCDGGKIARAAATSLSVENARALYLRPKLIHSGPMVHFRTQFTEPQAWSWVTLDEDAEKNELLDQCSFYAQHVNGKIDVNLRLLIGNAAFPSNLDGIDEKVTTVPLSIQVNIYQYEDGSTAKNVIGGVTINKRFASYVACDYPFSPALSNIFIGWGPRDGTGYNKYEQRFGSFDSNQRQRPAQLYPADFKFLQKISLSTTYGDETSFDPEKPLLVEVKCGYWSDAIGIDWDLDIESNLAAASLRTREYIRVFCVGSSIYERGVL